MKLARKILLYTCCTLISSTSLHASAMAADKEQIVKAAFLFNFTKFISWPEALAISKQSVIRICVIGNNSLGDATNVFKEGSTASLSIESRVISNAPSVPGECHIAFVSASEKGRVTSLLQSLKATSTLAVSDMDQFADMGGMIGFVNEENKVRLVVNKAAVDQAGLKADAQLLEIARRVIQ